MRTDGTTRSAPPSSIDWVKADGDERVDKMLDEALQTRRTACRRPARTPRGGGSRSSSSATSTSTTSQRDDPGADRTSRMSPYLKSG